MGEAAALSSLTEPFLGAFAGGPVASRIANLDTRLFSLDTPCGPLPATANDIEKSPTCYICCPSAAYADYAREELRNFNALPAVKSLLSGLIGLSRPLISAMRLDHQVQPNNWLFSTNIWCGLGASGLASVTADLLAAHPGRAIVWRSLNDLADRETLAAFRALGYRLFPARQIYLYDCRRDLPPIRRDMKNDLKVLARPDLQVTGPESIGPEDFGRIAALYADLYLDKYTRLNPHYTPGFMRTMHEAGLVEFHGLRDRDGLLQGIIGFFAHSGIMTAPVVGYDRSLPQEMGLYRRLVVLGMLEARKRRALYNMSAGAATFKRTRGAIPAIEYTAVYNRHLPPGARAAARVVEGLLAGIGIPLMRRFKL